MSTQKEGTLLLLLRNSSDPEVFLGKKHLAAKIGPGTRNGPGGGIEDGETAVECIIRETKEEVGENLRINDNDLEFVGIITFYKWSKEIMMKVHIFRCFKFEGEPKETDAMIDPRWYKVSQIPLEEMMPGDRLFMPVLLAGKGRMIRDGWIRFNKDLSGVEEYYLPTE